jgi:hypothetical protein
MNTIDCILIREADGTEVFYPRSDYASNPRFGSIVLDHKPKRPEPVIDPVVREIKVPPVRRTIKYGLYGDPRFTRYYY